MKQLIALTTALLLSNAYAKQSFCVFDLMGNSGSIFQSMRDLSLQAKSYGVDFELKAYKDEALAQADFVAGKCDAVSITSSRAKQLNRYVGSLEAFGAIPNDRVAKTMITTMMLPVQAPKMSKDFSEVINITPIGATYLFVNNKNINTLAKLAGRKVAVFDWNESHKKLAKRIGATPIVSDIDDFATKFNAGQVDLVASPAIAYRPLELKKGLGSKGAIAKFPLFYLSTVVMIQKNKFAPDFGQKMRTWSSYHLDTAFRNIEREERDIPEYYWMKIPEVDYLGYLKIVRALRIDLTKEGFYDPMFVKLAKKARCRHDANNDECFLNDE